MTRPIPDDDPVAARKAGRTPAAKMAEHAARINGWRIVWTIILFDMPTMTPTERRHYTQFRKMLLQQGMQMIQYSVYARCDLSEEKAAIIQKAIEKALPPQGEVRILQLTDRQYAKMKCFIGKARHEPEKEAQQLEFF